MTRRSSCLDAEEGVRRLCDIIVKIVVGVD